MISDRFYARFSMSIGAAGLKAIGRLNIPLYRLSRGRLMANVGQAPVLLLTSVGRRSGQRRTAPVCYLADGERLVVIGSNAGNAKAPAWVHNLRANPDAEVEIGRQHRQVRARMTEGEERERLWRQMNASYSGFDKYDARTDREIAVFALEPR